MRVLVDNYNKLSDESSLNEYNVECENCNSELIINETDLKRKELGWLYFDCPCCKKESYVDKIEDKLTYDMLEFPTSWSIRNSSADDDTLLLEVGELDLQGQLQGAIQELYDSLSKIEIAEYDTKEYCLRYYLGRVMLIMSKYRNEDNKYEYELELVKPLADTVCFDKYERIIYN